MKTKKIKRMTLGKKTIANLDRMDRILAGGATTTSDFCGTQATERPVPRCMDLSNDCGTEAGTCAGQCGTAATDCCTMGTLCC